MKDLFNLPAPEGFFVKAQVKIPVRPFENPLLENTFQKVVALYQERMKSLVADIERNLNKESIQKGSLFLVDNAILWKAETNQADVHHVGYTRIDPRTGKLENIREHNPNPEEQETNIPNRVPVQTPENPHASQEETEEVDHHNQQRQDAIGDYWKNEQGEVRYSKNPVGEHVYPASQQDVVNHYRKYRPIPFFSDKAGQHQVHQLMNDNFESLGLDPLDLQLMQFWQGGGAKAFKKSFSLGKDIGDVSKLTVKLGDKVISYEEAVVHFFKAQDFGADPSEIEQAVKDFHERYNKALDNPLLHDAINSHLTKIEKATQGYYIKAEGQAKNFEQVGEHLLSYEDPEKAHEVTTAALGALGLIKIPDTGEIGEGTQLKGALVPANNLLHDNDSWFLGKGKEQFSRLSASQMSTVLVGCKLNSMFDPENVTYNEDGLLRQPSEVEKHVNEHLAKKLGLDPNSTQWKKIQDHCSEVAIQLAGKFNKCNSGEERAYREIIEAGFEGLSNDKKIEEIKKYAEQWEKLRDSALKAQENKKLDFMPASMKDGLWGAHGTDGKDAKSHQVNKETGEPNRPFDHQIQTINWCETVKRGIIALDPGMGKTPTCIMLTERLIEQGKMKRAILFLPPSLMEQWPGEIERFSPGAKGQILNLSGMSLAERKLALKSDLAKNAKYILMSTGCLTDGKQPKDTSKPMDENQDDGTGGMDEDLMTSMKQLEGGVFIDEVHTGGYKTWGGATVNDDGSTKYEGSVRHRMVADLLQGREYGFGMTATPVPNHPMDLYNLGNLFAPGSMGGMKEWEGKTADTKFNHDTGKWELKNEQKILELNKRAKPWVFVKKINDPEVVKDMGKGLKGLQTNANDIAPSEAVCPVTGVSQVDWLRPEGVSSQVAMMMMDKIEKDREAKGKSRLEDSPFIYRKLLRGLEIGIHRLAAISPSLVDKRYKGPSPKLDQMVEDTLAHFQGSQGTEDKPIIIASSFPQKAFPLIRKKLIERGVDPSRIGTIDGTKSSKERAFQQDMTNEGKIKVLMLGTISGGAGLNLQKKSNKMFVLDKPWNPAAMQQLTGRVYRTGQENDVTINHYNTLGSYDMNIEQKLAGKGVAATGLLGAPDMDSIYDKSDEEIQKMSGRMIQAGEGKTKTKTTVNKKGEEKTKEYTVPTTVGEDQMQEIVGRQEQLRGLVEDTDLADLLGEDFKHFHPDNIEKLDNKNEPDMLDELAHNVGGNSMKKKDRKPKKEEEKIEVDPSVKQEALEKMKTTAIGFDVDTERRDWMTRKAMLSAKTKHDMHLQLADLADQRGEKETAEKSRGKAERVKSKVRNYHDALHQAANHHDKQAEEHKQKEDEDSKAFAKEHTEHATKKRKTAKELQSTFPEAFKDHVMKTEPEEPREPKGRGRPKGSKNKTKEQIEKSLGFVCTEEYLPFKKSMTEELGETGVSKAFAHYLWGFIQDGEHETLKSLADDTIGKLWVDPTPYVSEKGVEIIKSILNELEAFGVVGKG